MYNLYELKVIEKYTGTGVAYFFNPTTKALITPPKTHFLYLHFAVLPDL